MKTVLGAFMGSIIFVAALMFVIAAYSEAKAKRRPCPYRGGKCLGFKCREFSRCPAI